MKITQVSTLTNEHQFILTLERLSDKAVFDQLAEGIKEVAHRIAKEYVDANMDKITAGLDLKGLANLIAIYAAKNLGQSAQWKPND